MKAASKVPSSFEEALAELEKVVQDLEDGQTGLEAALARYEHGITLLRHCHKLLTQAEQKIQILSGVDETGQPVLQAFAAEK